ncbi:hypothetical protein FB107DRAFT_289261 [Schizophyllum commune]
MKGKHALVSSRNLTEEIRQARYHWAVQRCRKMEQRMSHILHPDIICRPRELQFVDEFRMVVGGLLNWMGCSHTTLLRAIIMRLADIINFAPLVSLVFVSRILPLYLWVSVINNETLRTIHLEAGLGSTGSIWPDAPRIRNLLITIRNARVAEGARRVIGLCPSLAFLSVISADADTPILHSIVRPISQCLDRSLRRLHLYGIDPSAVSFLSRALKSAAAPLPLTHLSLTSAEWTHLKRSCVLRLVRALRNLPDLRVLCLRGLQYAQPGLFRRIARDAPGLHALTVGHRVSILETNNPFYGARWPAPAYEYAKYLTGMRELRHLGVNMEILGRAYSPAGLLGIERRMAEPEVASSLDESDSEGELQEPDDYLTRDSARHTAAMFAAYAPVLESFFAGSEEDWVPMFSCTFDREDGGRIIVHERPSESEISFGIEAAGSKGDDSVLGPQRENPPMKLYADDVYEAQNRYWHADLHLRVTKDDKDPEELEYAEERVQRAREFCEIVLGRAYTNRLFESLIGYHTGSLDLTGRHPPRYMKLCTQIVAMAMELFALKDKVTISTREVLDWDFAQMKKVPCVEVVYDFEPPTLWDEFADKWHVKYSHDYGTLQRGVERCLSTIGAAKVRFQELLLTDLPPELLDYIISMASTEELAAWSGTCKLLRDHALTYTYEEIKYLLDSVHTLDADLMEKLRKRKDGQEKANNYVRKVALRQRNATVNRMRHILRQKDALAKTKKIIFYEDWTCDHWRWSELLGCSYNDFVGPLIKPLAQQIRLAPLTEFSYRSRSLYGLVWKAISQCSTLHTLTLLTSLPVSVQWPLATSVVNLALHMTEVYQPDFLWEIVTYCPSALYLGVFAPSRRGGTSIPRVVFGDNAYNPLTQLRRIELHGMDPGSIIVLAEAFVAAGLPPLTHFAISAPTNSHITREPVFALIRSLHNARQLQTLCISTLQYVQPDLFALIGENLPDLRLLALEHQPSKYREVRKGGTLWPRPSFEYAPHLAALPHLRHLGINISSYDLAYTPRAMYRLENGYDGAEDEDEHALNLLFSRSTEDVDLDMEDPRRIDRLEGSGSRSSPIELSDDEDMRAPVPKAQTLAVKAGRNNATRQASPATRSKSPAPSQRPATSLQSSPPVTQARAKAPAPAPANTPAKKQKGRSMIGYDPDPDPKSAHGCVPSEALASLAPWTPDPERTLVMENIPKAYRNHPEWVSKWALSVCGVAPPIVVTNKVLRDKAIIEFPSNALAASAWRSKRLNPELDKLPPDLLKGQPRLDFIRVYWLVVDGESPGYHLAQRRQQEVKAQMPASEAGESSSSSAPAPKQSKKQKQKQKAEGQSQQQPTQPPPSLTPYTDAAPAQSPTRSRRPSLSLTPYTDAAFAVSHGQPVPPLSYTPYADAFFPRRAQAAVGGRDIWDDDLYAQALASLPSLSTPALPPPPLFNDYAAPDKPPHSQASRPSQRPLKPTHIPPRSPSPFAIGPPIDIDMSAMHRRASSSSADCVMISPVRSNPVQSTAAYPPVRSTATCSAADPIVIDVDEGEYEVDGREQSLEPGEIRMDYVPPPAPAKAPLPPTRAPLLPTPQKAAPVASSKAGPSKAGPSKAGPSKGSHGREPVPMVSSSGKSMTAAWSGKSTAVPLHEPMATSSNTAVTPERMAMVQDKSEGMTQDESEGTTRLEDELKALVRQSRRMAPRAAPSHSTGPSSSHPTSTPSSQSTRPPSPPPQSATSASTTSLTLQSSQMSQAASSATVPQSAPATGTQTATAMASQRATATMVQSAAATVEDDAEMFIKMAISEASTQPPSEELSSETSAVQTSMPMAIEQQTQILQTSSRTQLSQSWPPHASSGLPRASSRPPPANSRPPPSTDFERLGDHLNESKRLLAMLSAAKTKEEREHIVVLIKEMNRRYATAGAAAASSTQQYTVGQTPKPRRKWPAPEQGPVIIEISDDEVDEYDEGR